MPEKIKRVKAIREFFGDVSMEEMKELIKHRDAFYELAEMCAKALGRELDI